MTTSHIMNWRDVFKTYIVNPLRTLQSLVSEAFEPKLKGTATLMFIQCSIAKPALYICEISYICLGTKTTCSLSGIGLLMEATFQVAILPWSLKGAIQSPKAQWCWTISLNFGSVIWNRVLMTLLMSLIIPSSPSLWHTSWKAGTYGTIALATSVILGWRNSLITS